MTQCILGGDIPVTLEYRVLSAQTPMSISNWKSMINEKYNLSIDFDKKWVSDYGNDVFDYVTTETVDLCPIFLTDFLNRAEEYKLEVGTYAKGVAVTNMNGTCEGTHTKEWVMKAYSPPSEEEGDEDALFADNESFDGRGFLRATKSPKTVFP